MNRVVITGVGVVTAVGCDKDTFWQNIKDGVCGIDYITRFDASNQEVKVAAEVKDFDPLKTFEKKELRRTDLYTQYAMDAARQALEDCGSDLKDLDPFDVGVIVGSGIGGFTSIEAEHARFLEKGGRRVSPYFIPMMISNMAAGEIGIRTGFKGANFGLVTACATSSHAIGEAFRKIKDGYLKACVAGGSEGTITEFSIAGFHNMKALSTSQDPKRASIPFDKDRDGFVMGEGAGIVILEELEHAKARGAHIYAEIVGYGATGDAYHITSPDPTGVAPSKAMKLAFEEGGFTGADVDYINVHGTSTPLNDKYETNAIKMALGEEAARKVMISSTKSMTGHMLGAAGAVEAIVCARALEDGIVPGTIGFQTPDEDCDLNNMTNGTEAHDIKVALSNSLGFGGHNACLCLKKYEG